MTESPDRRELRTIGDLERNQREILRKAFRDANMAAELAKALRNLIAAEDEYGDESNVAVNQALELARIALAKYESK